ncbi:MAG: lysostaphin resistance A-like protein [Halanaeroarchaeum sp.]
MSDATGPPDAENGAVDGIDAATWERPAYAIGAAVGLALAGVLASVVIGVAVGGALAALDLSLTVTVSFVVTFVAGSIGFVTVAALYLRRRVADPIAFVGVRVPSLSEAAWTVGGYLAAFGAILAAAVVMTVLGVSPDTANRAAVAGMRHPTLLLWLVPLSFLVIAPGEELLFRGTVQRRLRGAFPAWIAIVLTAVIFATIHFVSLTGGAGGRFVAIGVLFLPSLIFGTVYEVTENLVVPILVHGAYNATLFGLIYVSVAMLPQRAAILF